MIFIVGTGRSGTNMLRDMLNLHSEVYIPQETHWWPLLLVDYGRTRNPIRRYLGVMEGCHYHDGLGMLSRILDQIGMEHAEFTDRIAQVVSDEWVDLERFAPAFYQVVGGHMGATIFGDKTPEYGAFMTGLATLWPNARFVHVVRDGRAVARSMAEHDGFRMMARDGIAHWPLVTFSGSRNHPLPVERGRTLRRLRGIPLERGFKFEGFLELWAIRLRRIREEAAGIPEAKLMEIRYEDILEDPRSTVRAVAEFADVGADDVWLDAVAREAKAGRPKPPSRMPGEDAPDVREMLEAYGYE